MYSKHDNKSRSACGEFNFELEAKGTFTTGYCGNMIYENGSLKRILVDGGYYENGTYYFYLTDHLGNNRVVANQSGSVVQSTQYYPFGMAFADGTNPSAQPYKFDGKELDNDRGLNLYDFHARWQDAVLGGRFLSVNPLAEKYYSVSPYVYCMNNPVRFVDPDGRDIWELDKDGNIVNHIEDKTQDAFYMVAKDADGKYQRTYTMDEEGNRTYNSISFDYGTVTSVREETSNIDGKDVKMTSFNIKGDNKASQLFKFMANPNNVEWKQLKVDNIVGDKGLNIVATSHEQSEVIMKTQGYLNSIREEIHNHTSGNDRPSRTDLNTRDKILSKNPNAKFYIYTPEYGYRPFTTLLDVLRVNVRNYAK